jgi:hypothetical protein
LFFLLDFDFDFLCLRCVCFYWLPGMRSIISWLLAACLLAAGLVRANVQAVFAHFLVGNTGLYTVADWEDDISKAAAAHIDGFVLNMANGEATNGASLTNAFTAANNLGSSFKLLFSFDYAGNGLWNKQDVIALINQYSSNSAYYRRGSQPLVSTFEGPAASGDWPSIKAATGCFFMPSWSSLGAAPAWAKGTADGLFSWEAWPEGPNSMSTFTDHSYLDTLGGAPYMMGVSPWFYTNMPGYRKNWLWRGDSLWFDRWVHVMYLQPEYVQIISWNGFGESHHIGPLRDKAYAAFDGAHGRAPFNYVLDKPHDGWRTFLPFLIDMAKSGTASFNQENVVAWYRETPGSACGTGGTTGNTASQLQQTYPPAVLAQDRIFYAALLGSPASVSVSIGGQSAAGTWDITPSGGIGLYRGSVPIDGRTGAVVVSITRSGSDVIQASGDPITTACTNGMTNWNPSVVSGNPHSIAPATPLLLAGSVCTGGLGDPKYLDLCSFACRYGYCPPVCTCTSLGAAAEKPAALNVNGCPAAGMDSTYLGLCSFGCNYGYCPPSLCQVHPSGYVCTAPDPTAPPVPACVSGMADGAYADLCSFSCYYGFCPPEICTCTQAGSAAGAPSPPPVTGMVGGPKGGAVDYGLCQWACRHGNCPSHLCACSGGGCPGGGGTPGGLSFQYPSKLAITRSLGGRLMGGFGFSWGGPDFDASLNDPSICRLSSSCTNQNSSHDSRCGPHEVKLGWDKAGCEGGGSYGRSICCAAWEAVTKCVWRGEESDGGCNAQCTPGEVQVWQSPWGNKQDRCKRGTKAFCCLAIEYSLAMRGCHWSSCGISCNSVSEARMLSKRTGPKSWGDGATDCLPVQHFCCPKEPLLSDCVWRGTSPRCDDAKCQEDEIAVALSPFGNSEERCRSKYLTYHHSLPTSQNPRTCG